MKTIGKLIGWLWVAACLVESWIFHHIVEPMCEGFEETYEKNDRQSNIR